MKKRSLLDGIKTAFAKDWTGSFGLVRDPCGNPRSWMTTEEMSFTARLKQKRIPADTALDIETLIRFTIKPGFRTDIASVHRALWWYASPVSGRHAAAAVLHDLLYRSRVVSRAVADEVFLKGMLACGVRASKAKAMYAAVRMFGSGPWNNTSERERAITAGYIRVCGLY